ncbi:alpha/beta fold hydrolase [Marinobacter guineae]|uniref:alpha/beta fold hydrolase n=1 Tax=Marinobacter guineae TaxID=432303 RepID=UPI001B8022AA|nr:alpha/beta hydrolase [Marinobacter guineae]
MFVCALTANRPLKSSTASLAASIAGVARTVLRVIDDAGHLVIEEKPDELVKEILDFVEA